MNVLSNISNDEIKGLVNKNSKNQEVKPISMEGLDELETPKSETASISNTTKRRSLLVVGCGDGGCNIAVAIKKQIPDFVSCVLYNTSQRAMERHMQMADSIIVPKTEDGSGKDREYSKDVFRKGHYKTLLAEVNELLQKREYDYILVTTTTDGGTGGGASPNIAKFLSSNSEVPVIILGVLPSLSEDAKAQYNALKWQEDVEKTELPHIIFDNNASDAGSKVAVHHEVNRKIAEAMEVITGVAYGDTTISSIDNRDMLMILINSGKRIVVDTTVAKPNVGESFDDFLLSILSGGLQPMPKNATAIGIFVKGPKQFIESVDTSLMAFRNRVGNGQVYTHIEESDAVRISVIASGCTSYDDRMYLMRQRYDDIMASMNAETTKAADVLDGMKNPFETKIEKKVMTSEMDTSGLDL